MSRPAEAEAATGSTPPVPLRRNRGFRLLWIGQVVSDTGTEAGLIAYPLLILALTHSPTIAGLVGTVRMVVQLILGLPGGALSDRLDRRLTMIVCDSGRAVVLALLAALVLVHLVSWPVVLVIAVIDGGANVLFDPSASAALPAIVADEQLEQAWATTQGRSYAAGLAGPALGGFLFGLGRAVPFAGDATARVGAAGWRRAGADRCGGNGGCVHVCRIVCLCGVVTVAAPLLAQCLHGEGGQMMRAARMAVRALGVAWGGGVAGWRGRGRRGGLRRCW